MDANDFFGKALRINPVAGKFVVGGGLVLAVAAMAIAWFGDKADLLSILAAGGMILGSQLRLQSS